MDNNIFGQTDIGKTRDNNEDAFLAEELGQSKFLLACVIDGVGGYAGGEVAAAIAKDVIRKHLANVRQNKNIVEHLITAVKLANEEIFAKKQENDELAKMACVLTLVLADIENNQFYYAHVGDTRLYLLRDQALVKITQDQSFVGFLEDSGRLTEAAAMSHPKRNEINQALGLERTERLSADFIETGQSPFLPGDALLLCSDGLTDRVEKDKITSGMLSNATLQGAVAFLIDAANAAGGHDNITVVLLRNHKERIQHAVAKPAVKTTEIPVHVVQNVTANSPVVVQKVNLNRGWIAFLSLVSLVSISTAGWLYLQVETLKKSVRPIAPVYESPWPSIVLKPADTLREQQKNLHPVKDQHKHHGKRSAE